MKTLPNRNYVRGRDFEYKIVNRLKAEGFSIAVRSAGSHSPIDIWAVNFQKRKIKLVQCKSGISKKAEIRKALQFLKAGFTEESNKNGYYWVDIEFA